MQMRVWRRRRPGFIRACLSRSLTDPKLQLGLTAGSEAGLTPKYALRRAALWGPPPSYTPQTPAARLFTGTKRLNYRFRADHIHPRGRHIAATAITIASYYSTFHLLPSAHYQLTLPFTRPSAAHRCTKYRDASKSTKSSRACTASISTNAMFLRAPSARRRGKACTNEHWYQIQNEKVYLMRPIIRFFRNCYSP